MDRTDAKFYPFSPFLPGNSPGSRHPVDCSGIRGTALDLWSGRDPFPPQGPHLQPLPCSISCVSSSSRQAPGPSCSPLVSREAFDYSLDSSWACWLCQAASDPPGQAAPQPGLSVAWWGTPHQAQTGAQAGPHSGKRGTACFLVSDHG